MTYLIDWMQFLKTLSDTIAMNNESLMISDSLPLLTIVYPLILDDFPVTGRIASVQVSITVSKSSFFYERLGLEGPEIARAMVPPLALGNLDD
jgi:hypothetical protein